MFLDLRDREGMVQLVLHPQEQPDAYRAAEAVRPEYVVRVEGVVRARLEGAINQNLATGEVEVAAVAIVVLSEAETTPFQIEDRLDASEEVRLKHRYLDLRRPEMHRVLMLRHRTISAIRRHFEDEGFVEVETPMLNKSTPEGARDYLVPSRLQPGTFFALQQSPQLFKQLLMVAGIDRYYQVVRCFRDEDPRSDRQPDFTQLDMEMSFADESAVKDVTERMFVSAMKASVGVDIPTPFPQITYEEAMSRFGTDRPDLRFGLELADVTSAFEQTGVQVFKRTLDGGGRALALRLAEGDRLDRKSLDELAELSRGLGAGGLAWIRFESEGISSPLAKALSEDELGGLKESLGISSGDLVLLVCDEAEVARRVLGEVRLSIADKLGLRPALPLEEPDAWKFVWVVDAPLVQYNSRESRWDPVHHPFTAPSPADEHLLDSDPGAVRARAYDVVLNGWEVAGGSIRIHNPELQRRIFKLIGIDDETAERRFGWFVRAFDFGAPPHGGIAAGLDRLVALLAGKENIREVIAFPKTSAMTDIMTGAPDIVDPKQLSELQIKTVQPAPPGR